MKPNDIRIDRIDSKDETFSYSGLKDFQKPADGDVRDLPRVAGGRSRPRTKSSLNNSYS